MDPTLPEEEDGGRHRAPVRCEHTSCAPWAGGEDTANQKRAAVSTSRTPRVPLVYVHDQAVNAAFLRHPDAIASHGRRLCSPATVSV